MQSVCDCKFANALELFKACHKDKPFRILGVGREFKIPKCLHPRKAGFSHLIPEDMHGNQVMDYLGARALHSAVWKKMVVMPDELEEFSFSFPGAAHLHRFSIHGMHEYLFHLCCRAGRQLLETIWVVQAGGEETSRKQVFPGATQHILALCNSQSAVGVACHDQQGEAPAQPEMGEIGLQNPQAILWQRWMNFYKGGKHLEVDIQTYSVVSCLFQSDQDAAGTAPQFQDGPRAAFCQRQPERDVLLRSAVMDVEEPGEAYSYPP